MYGFSAGPLLNVVKITVVAWLTVTVCTALAWAGIWYYQDTQVRDKCVTELEAKGYESLAGSLCD